MSSVQEHLEDWRAAGVVDAETAARISAYERGRPRQADERPSIAEALVYLGAAVVAVGVVVLVGSNWDSFEPGARAGVMGLPAALAVLAGFGLRATGEPELKRGGSIAWLLAVALTAGTVGVLTGEAEWDDEDAVLAAVTAGTLMALVLWTIGPSHAQVLGVLGGLGALSIALGIRADSDGPVYAGVIAAGFGAAGIALAEARLFRPKASAQVLSALLVGIGAYVAGIGDSVPAWAEVMAPAVGAALIVLSIVRGVFAYIALGVATLFFGLVTLILREVEDPTAAAFALMIMGGVLVAAVLILVKVRPWRGGKAAAA